MPLMAGLISLLTHSPNTTLSRIASSVEMKIVRAPCSTIIASALFTVLVVGCLGSQVELARCR